MWAEEDVIPPHHNLFVQNERCTQCSHLSHEAQLTILRYGRSLRFGEENLWHTQQSSDSLYQLSSSVSDKITSTAFF